MKKKAFITAMLLAATTLPSLAQVIDVPSIAAKTSLIRSYTPGKNLLYAHNTGGQKYICLTDNTSTSYFILPFSYAINDIEVRGDTAFFCGTYAWGSQQAMYGFFCISDVFYGSGSMHAFVCSPTPPSPIISSEFTKLDILNNTGNVSFAFIATLTLSSGNTVTAVASMNNIGTPVFFNYTPNNQINYTDICCLDDMVVAVGQDYHHSDCITKAYHPIPNFVTAPYSTTSAFSITNYECPYSGGPFFIKNATENRAAISMHTIRNASTIIYKLLFHPSTGQPSAYLPATRTIVPWVDPYDPTSWKLYEMIYDGSTRTMYLLENGRHLPTGTFERWLLPFSMTTTETSINGITLSIGDQMSLDIEAGTSYPITSGISSLAMPCYYYEVNPNANNCQFLYHVPTKPIEVSISEQTYTFATISTATMPLSPSIAIQTIHNTTECN